MMGKRRLPGLFKTNIRAHPHGSFRQAFTRNPEITQDRLLPASDDGHITHAARPSASPAGTLGSSRMRTRDNVGTDAVESAANETRSSMITANTAISKQLVKKIRQV